MHRHKGYCDVQSFLLSDFTNMIDRPLGFRYCFQNRPAGHPTHITAFFLLRYVDHWDAFDG